MDKEALKEIFGTIGDFKPELERMFGEAYTNFGDTTGNIPQELSGFDVSNVGSLIERAIEQSPDIACKFNQIQILRFIDGYIQGKDFITNQEWWSVIKHINECGEAPCHELYEIACRDISISPREMDEIYGDKIKNWKIK
jgi:hypothetical protein